MITNLNTNIVLVKKTSSNNKTTYQPVLRLTIALANSAGQTFASYGPAFSLLCRTFFFFFFIFLAPEFDFLLFERGLENGPWSSASGRARDLELSFCQYGPTKAGE